MKATTLQAKIQKHLTTKKGAIKDRYSFYKDFLVQGYWFGKSWRGRGRHISLSDTQYNAAIEICDALGIDYKLGNDAPRGGKEGDFVEITKKGKRQIAEWLKIEKARRAEEKRKKDERKAAKKAEIDAKVTADLEKMEQNPEVVEKFIPKEDVPTDKIFSKRQFGGKFDGMAKELHTINDISFYYAVHKYFNPEFTYTISDWYL